MDYETKKTKPEIAVEVEDEDQAVDIAQMAPTFQAGGFTQRWESAACGVRKGQMAIGKKDQLFKSKARLRSGILQTTTYCSEELVKQPRILFSFEDLVEGHYSIQGW